MSQVRLQYTNRKVCQCIEQGKRHSKNHDGPLYQGDITLHNSGEGEAPEARQTENLFHHNGPARRYPA